MDKSDYHLVWSRDSVIYVELSISEATPEILAKESILRAINSWLDYLTLSE